MLWLASLVALLVVIVVLVYYLAPATAFRWAMALARRKGGLGLKHVTVDGHDVPYLEGGAGPPLLLLHGFGANKDHWTMIAPLLTPHYRVIAPDIPGFGDSSRLPGAGYSLDDMMRRLAAFADALGLDRFHIGGNSMGGYLSALFATRHPERVDSVWLLAPAGVMSAEPSETLALIEAGENPLIATDMAAFDRLADLCFTVQPPMPSRFKQPLLERSIREAPFNQHIFEQLFGEPVTLEDTAAACRAPTLLVWGDNDRVLHPSGQRILEPLLPRVRTHLMSRMGHVPMIERPAETAKDYLAFRQAVAAGGI